MNISEMDEGQCLIRFKELFGYINKNGPFNLKQVCTVERRKKQVGNLWFKKTKEFTVLTPIGFLSNTVNSNGFHELMFTNRRDGHDLHGEYPAYIFKMSADGDVHSIHKSALTMNIVWAVFGGQAYRDIKKLRDALGMFETIATGELIDDCLSDVRCNDEL